MFNPKTDYPVAINLKVGIEFKMAAFSLTAYSISIIEHSGVPFILFRIQTNWSWSCWFSIITMVDLMHFWENLLNLTLKMFNLIRFFYLKFIFVCITFRKCYININSYFLTQKPIELSLQIKLERWNIETKYP